MKGSRIGIVWLSALLCVSLGACREASDEGEADVASAPAAEAQTGEYASTPLMQGIPPKLRSGEVDPVELIQHLPEELQTYLASSEPGDRMYGITDLDDLPPDLRVQVLAYLWEEEPEQDVRNDIVDEVGYAGGKRAAGFLLQVAADRQPLQIRDDALYYLKTEAKLVDPSAMKPILYQENLPSDLIWSVVSVIRENGSDEARKILREAGESHPREDTQIEALRALGAMGDLAFLQERLQKEESQRIREVIERTLRKQEEKTETKAS